MKLSTRARYALRMLLSIAQHPGEAPVSLGTVSRETSISRRYLDQLAIALKSASLVLATSGRGGGYRLARPANEINLAEIVEAAIGPINIVPCINDPTHCAKSNCCEPRQVYQLINQRITEVFATLTLAELADSEALHSFIEAWTPRSARASRRPIETV